MIKNKYPTGFTIVELLVVIVIIAILASISVGAYNGINNRALDASRQSDIVTIKRALAMYYADNGRYPIPSTACPTMQNSGAFGCGYYDTRPDDASWSAFKNDLAPYLNDLPFDRKKSYAPPWVAGGYAYAYYSGYSSCGVTPGSAYILFYRLDTSQSVVSDADCPDLTTAQASKVAIGTSYYASPRN